MKDKVLDFRKPAVPGNRWRSIPRLKSILQSEIVHTVLETFTTRIALVGLGLVASILVTRILGPAGRGHYAMAVAISGFVIQFGNLGLHTSNTYAVARDKRLLPLLIGNILAVVAVLGGGSAVLTAVVIRVWPNLAGIGGLLLGLTLLSIPLGLGQMLLQNLLIGVQEIRKFNKIELATSVLSVVFIILFAISRIVSVETVFVASLLATAIAVCWTFISLRALLNGPVSLSASLFKENFRYGIRVYVGALFAYSLLRIDVFMVHYILGEIQTGYYSVAATMADMLYLLPSVIGVVLFPKLSATTNSSDRWRLTQQVTFAVTLVMVAVSAIAVVFSRPAIQLLLGAAFLPAAAPFLILSVAMIFYGANNVVSCYLAAEGLPLISVYVWIVAVALNVSLNAIFIPLHGISGAAAASLVSYLMVFIVQYVYASRAAKAG
jgi:O-antigen/teichoic acid export membrane protein